MSEARHKEEHGRRRIVWIGLALAILLDTIMQLVWKRTVMDLPMANGILRAIGPLLREPLFWVLLALLVAQFFNWMMVLARSDISFAQPITALSYVAVATLSTMYLGERFTLMRGVALVLILAGVWLIGTTPAQTKPAPAPGRSALAGGRR